MWASRLQFPGLSVRVTTVTNCTVNPPAQYVCHQVQSGSPYLGQARYMIHDFTDSCRQARKLQLTVTDHVNNGFDPEKN